MSSSNGIVAVDTRSRTVEARREAKLIEAELRLGHLKRAQARQRRLTESQEAWEWLDGFGEVLDRMRGPERDLVLPISTAQDRRYGANWPFWRTWLEHARLRAAARLLHGLSTLAQGAIRGLTNYVIGEGFTTRAKAKQGANPPKALVGAVQAAVDDFAAANGWAGKEGLQRELFLRDRRDGESILRDFPQGDGMLLVRTVEPECVLEPPQYDPDEWSFGIRTDPEDVQTRLGMWVAYNGNTAKGEEVPWEELTYHKVNTDRQVKRGLTDLCFDTYDTLKSGQRLIEHMSEGAAIQASIALIRQHEGTSADQATEFAAGVADYEEQGPFGQTKKVERFYPGKILDVPKGMTHGVPPFAANAQGFVTVVQAVLRSVAVRWNAPEWLISGDASNNNYSSSITAESPFVKSCKAEQGAYKDYFHSVQVKAVKARCDAGTLYADGRKWSWDEVKRLVELQVEPPTIEVRNKQEEASTNASYIQAKVKSPQTVQQELGLDSEQEATNLEEWDERFGGDGGALPMPGEPGADDELPPLPDDLPPEEDAGPGGDGGANELRATVGGLQAIADLQRAVYAGELPREAAVANARIMFGFDPEQAAQLFPEVAPVKTAPGDGDDKGEEGPAFTEGLLEGCIPNKGGKGHHDDKTGAPCHAGGVAAPASQRGRVGQAAAAVAHKAKAAIGGAIRSALARPGETVAKVHAAAQAIREAYHSGGAKGVSKLAVKAAAQKALATYTKLEGRYGRPAAIAMTGAYLACYAAYTVNPKLMLLIPSPMGAVIGTAEAVKLIGKGGRLAAGLIVGREALEAAGGIEGMLDDLEAMIGEVAEAAGEEAPRFRREDLKQHLVELLGDDAPDEGLGEACVPNKTGKGYHDDRKGTPCKPTGTEQHAHAKRAHAAAGREYQAASRAWTAAHNKVGPQQARLDRAQRALKAAKGAKAQERAKAAVAKERAALTARQQERAQAGKPLAKLHGVRGKAQAALDAAAAKLQAEKPVPKKAPVKPASKPAAKPAVKPAAKVEKPAPQKAEPAKAAAPPPEHLQKVAQAFLAHKGSASNLVSLADLKDATGLSKEQLHAAVNHLRKEGALSGVGAEGRHGLSPRDREAMLHDRGDQFAGVSGDHDALKKLAGEKAPAPPARPPSAPTAPEQPKLTLYQQGAAGYFEKQIKAAPGLSEEQRTEYAGHMTAVIGQMSDAALARVAKHLGPKLGAGVHFQPSFDGVKDHLMEVYKDNAVVSDNLKQYSTLCGAYYRHEGKAGLVVDGGGDEVGQAKYDTQKNQMEHGSWSARGIYAHELTHVVDGPGYELSLSPEWQSAFSEEIKGGQLTRYAMGNQHEGFAEFGRLVLDPSRAGEREAIKAAFPKCYVYWQSQKLVEGIDLPRWPGEDAALLEAEGVALEELFGDRVELDDEGGHADVLLGDDR